VTTVAHVTTAARLLVTSVLALSALGVAVPVAATAPAPGYRNSLDARMPGGTRVTSCPDPSVLHGQGRASGSWYLYCTSNPLDDAETSGHGAPVGHRLPMLSSQDLVHWRFVGSALPGKPSWAARSAKLWAPDVVYSTTFHRYYLTYAVTDTASRVSGQRGCAQDPAIGLATSASPTGPWRMAPRPLVPPRRLGPGCSFASTIDPDVLGARVRARSVLYVGSFRGGISAQRVVLTATGMGLRGAPTQVTAATRYEAANVVRRHGFYYLFASAGSCCNGPLSGYGVFAGRSRSALGPFVDREGNLLTSPRTGGTPVLTDNGNRWVGPGHNSVFRDLGGQWWTVYHAIDRFDPFFATEPGFTRRPPLLDPVDWVGGWPTVRSGRGASDRRVAAPATEAGRHTAYRPRPLAADVPGAALPSAGDTFDGSRLGPPWHWVRRPAAGTYALEHGALRFDTQAAGLSGPDDTASVLARPAPDGDYLVQTEVRLDVPVTGCCYGYVQAGLLLSTSDDDFVKLTTTTFRDVRVTEFTKEVPETRRGYPVAGSTTVGPPADRTWLRVVHLVTRAGSRNTAWTSQDGRAWVRGGTWTMADRGRPVSVGLVSMGGAGWTARFDDVRVWRLGR
jgi:arabinan endo-1,5-alpha-L-arabinosidase